jgi:hypothetical protein
MAGERAAHQSGQPFAAFDVDPGGTGPTTAIHVTYYAVTGPYGDLTPVDRFTLTRPRHHPRVADGALTPFATRGF